jgi:hypothetical protein
LKEISDDKSHTELRAEFGTQVIDLYKAAVAGKLAEHGNADSGDVRAVAFGLIALRNAVDHFLQSHPGEALHASGMYQANAILEALTTPSAHPIWSYISSLQSQRVHLAPSGATVQKIRDMIGGIVLAYKQASGAKSVKKAADAVHDRIKPPDFPFSADLARKWAAREDAEGMARRFLAYSDEVPDCDSPAERVLIIGCRELFPLVTSPVAQAK